MTIAGNEIWNDFEKKNDSILIFQIALRISRSRKEKNLDVIRSIFIGLTETFWRQ